MITPILIHAVAAWAIAQAIKMVIASASGRKLAWRYLSTGGGMPSSHSAMVCACATGVGFHQGVDDPLFAIAAVLAFIVMYDACNVRWQTGKQAKALNCMMRAWSGEKPEFPDRELKEMLGHTPFQVAMGAVLGVAVGAVGSLLTA
ncbi:MAG TPA: divergent PAP2 family protein [Candidatus Enterenecus merdae]|nr:divergent PAP2 family protein [Candidatus Enterenecus merdae]